MKARPERISEATVKELLEVLDNHQDVVAEVLTEMELTHSDVELAADRRYCALVSAMANLAATRESMTYWLERRVCPGVEAVGEKCGEKVIMKV